METTERIINSFNKVTQLGGVAKVIARSHSAVSKIDTKYKQNGKVVKKGNIGLDQGRHRSIRAEKTQSNMPENRKRTTKETEKQMSRIRSQCL